MKKLYKIIIICSGIVLLFVLLINIPENRNEFTTPHFTFRYSSSIDSSSIVGLSKILESSYSKVGSNLQTSPAQHIEVNIYSQRWRYIQATKNWGASGSIEGISTLHFIENTWLDSEISKTAVHEFTHAVVLKLLIDREPHPLDVEGFDKKFSKLPVWIWEAVSVYEAGEFHDPKSLEYFKNGKYPQISELNNRSKGQKIYTCGYTLIEYILNTYGQDTLIRLIESYGDIQTILNITEEQFSKDWHTFLSEKYLK